MTEISRDEKCRVIAEWLEWSSYLSRDGRFTEWVSPAQFRYVAEAGYTHSAVAACSSALPDFYSSESASALILEKFSHPTLYKGIVDDLWVCHPTGMSGNATIEGCDADRKTAIAEAGYQVAMAERKRDE